MTGGPGALISLSGKTALVTGASRGIGRSVAVMLGRAGAFVAVNYRADADAGRETVRLVEAAGGSGIVLPFDVTVPADVEDALKRLLDERSGIDILVNNAGVARDGLIGRMKDEDWSVVMETDLTAAFYLCRAVSRPMIRKRGGRIVNIASTAGEAGNAGQANYSAAKAGLIGLTKALARELAPRNILVNAVSPGIIGEGMSESLTEQQTAAIIEHVPLRRVGTGEDVASAVTFLCSDMSKYITGQVIGVNGGLYM